MAQASRIQNNLTSGEIAPLLRGRIDLTLWKNSGKRLTNTFVLPQGGSRRRDGLRYRDELSQALSRLTAGITVTAPNGGTIGNANDNDPATLVTTTVALGAANPYVVVQYDLGISKVIKFVDVVRFRNNTNANQFNDFVVQYSDDAAAWNTLGAAIPCSINTIAMADANTRRRSANGISARYWRFARVGATDYGGALFSLAEFNLWQETGALSDSRVVDVEISASQRYALVFSDLNARVYLNGVPQADIRSDFTSAQLAQLNWSQSLDTVVLAHEDVATFKLQRAGADAQWHSQPIVFDQVPRYAFVLTKSNPAFTLTPSAVSGNITLTTSAGFWVAGHVGQIVDGGAFGRARIITVDSTTVAKAIVLVPFFNTTALASGAWTLEEGYEPVWSATRGYAGAVIFRQNRLVLGGFKSLPNSLAFSRNGEFFDFDNGQALDDDGMFGIIQADDVPAIYNFKNDRELQIFTSTSEYYVPQAPGAAITPRTLEFRRSTSRGSKRGVRPVNVSGSTLFLERGGNAVRQFVWSYEQEAHVAPSFTFHASHLILDPVDLCLRRASDNDECDQLIMVTNDGRAIVGFVAEGINAWTPHTTDGTFLHVGAVDTMAYFVVQRTIGGAARRYVETFDKNLLLDSAVPYGMDGPVLSGLLHLEGKTVKVRADDSTLGDEVVAGGQITADRAIEAAGEAGLFWVPDLELQDAIGSKLDKKLRISRVMVDFFETQNALVNGNKVAFRKFAEGAASPLDEPPPIFTGKKVVDGILGWSRENAVTVTQDEPAPLTVRLLEYQIRV